jgi:hypothetical protein
MVDGHVSPVDGGFWYCRRKDDRLALSWEFDAYVHTACIEERVMSHPDDREARIFAKEFNIKEESAHA